MIRSINILGEGRYSASENQQFTDKEGRLVRVIKESPRDPQDVGEAYAFFYCNAPKEEIERELPNIREISQTPKDLELYLTEGILPDRLNHPELREIAMDAKRAGLRYTLKANYLRATNERTATELEAIMRTAYSSPLYKKGEDFRGEVYFKDKPSQN
jgi:hypothetical protein